MIDVLLAHSFFLKNDPKQVEKMRPYPPLGTLYAASYLRERGFSVALFDAMLAAGEEEFTALLDAHAPSLVVFNASGFARGDIRFISLEQERSAIERMQAIVAKNLPRTGGALLAPNHVALVDGLILIVASLLLAAVFGGLGDAEDVGTGATLIAFLVAVSYEVGFVGTIGATPGKLALRLRVVAQEDGRTPPGWDKAFLRYSPSLVALVPVIGTLLSLAVVVVSLIWLYADDRCRTVYDRVATTYVVKV